MTAATRTFILECYSPAVDRQAVESAHERASAAVDELRRHGRRIGYVGALLLPADEVVFHLFTAGSARAVHEATLRAGVESERVLEVLPVGIDVLPGAPTIGPEQRPERT